MIGRTAHRGLAALLVLAAVGLPAVPASAAPGPGPEPRPTPTVSGPVASGIAPRKPAVSDPAARLVPGIPLTPYQPWQRDTPDQALPPRVYEPSEEEDAVEPLRPPAAIDALIEYVPPAEVVAAKAAPACSKRTGPYQRQVERWLKLTVDGRQSAKDCAAVAAFQRQQKIRPASGFAGPVTWSRMRWLSARKNPNAAKKCPTRAYRLACVDLARQLMWVQQDKKVLFGPVPIRSGRAGYTTRAGWHKVYWRHKNHWSTLYNTPMPYSQFFSGGQALHAIYGSVYNPPGSHGCVNMRFVDAQALWGVLKKGDRVYAWGRKPGT
ncbi:L,D-transpeptidase family protein [Streptomyces sp. NPDC059009]|uniref:L,D-transpeptidase family protein n=1 Tax=Streptomyces sp. NPDC059009 TaxID=3346694 RepID=UPI0036B5B7BD